VGWERQEISKDMPAINVSAVLMIQLKGIGAEFTRKALVIGVHGSNMLFTYHMQPVVLNSSEDRYGNIVQDISVRYPDRRQLIYIGCRPICKSENGCEQSDFYC